MTNNLKKAKETGAIITQEASVLDIEGNKLWYHSTIVPVNDDEGKLNYMLVVSLDTTERKRAEEALREGEEKFRSFAEQSLVGIYLISDGLFKYVNPKFAEMFGYSGDECLDNMHFPQLVHPEDLATVEKQVGKRLSGETKAVRYSFRGIKKSGETIHVEIFGSSMLLKGKIVITGTMLDITERKRAEEALREGEEKFRSLITNIPDVTWTTDYEGKTSFISPNIEKEYGYTPEEITKGGDNIWLGRIHPEDAEKVEKAFKELFEEGTMLDVEYRIKRKDGEWIWLHDRSIAIYERDGVMYADGIFTNITERKWAEESLRESHKRYQLIVENISNVVWTMDMNFHNTFVSPSVYQQRGYTPEEVKNQPLSERMNPNSIEKVFNLYNEKLKLIGAGDSEGWKPIEFEIEQPCKDGSTIWTTNTVRFLPGPDKQPASLLGTTHDITERKRAEEALRESEGLLRSAIESTEDGILAVSQNGETILANSRFRKMWHISDGLFNRKDDEQMLNFVLGQLKKPDNFLSKVRDLYGTTREDLDVLEFKDGRIIERYSRPMTIGAKITGRVWSFRDITKRTQAEIALRESEEKYRTILESTEDGYYEVDIHGNFTFFNDSLCEIYGYPKNEMMGLNIRKLTDQETAKRGYSLFNKVFTTGRSEKYFGWRIIRKDGSKREVEASVSPKKNAGGVPRGFRGIIRDISEKQKLEDQLQHAQKMEAIGTLAGGVAHDLNNILGGLVSYPELLLLQLPQNSPLRKSILTIQKSGEKAAAVVQDLLTLARRGVVVTDVVSLNDVISEYLKSPEHENLQSYHPGIRIETHLEKDTLNILGSSTHLSKTVMNLVSNAAEAMSDGGNLTLSTENRYIDRPIRSYDDVKEGDYVVLTISDTGTGISPDDIDKIFEPFYTKKKMGRSGTGLGMTVVWGTLKDHNGYIDVQSTEGKGTTFTLYFPATHKKLPEDKSHLAIESYSGKGESILVIDDVEEQRKIASGMLKELGYSVVSVSSGEEAVEYLKINKADLLVLDMIMDPGMDGLDTYKKILKIHPEQKAIIASGFSETDRVKELQSLGAGAYIRKPFLLEKIGPAVKGKLEK